MAKTNKQPLVTPLGSPEPPDSDTPASTPEPDATVLAGMISAPMQDGPVNSPEAQEPPKQIYPGLTIVDKAQVVTTPFGALMVPRGNYVYQCGKFSFPLSHEAAAQLGLVK